MSSESPRTRDWVERLIGRVSGFLRDWRVFLALLILFLGSFGAEAFYGDGWIKLVELASFFLIIPSFILKIVDGDVKIALPIAIAAIGLAIANDELESLVEKHGGNVTRILEEIDKNTALTSGLPPGGSQDSEGYYSRHLAQHAPPEGVKVEVVDLSRLFYDLDLNRDSDSSCLRDVYFGYPRQVKKPPRAKDGSPWVFQANWPIDYDRWICSAALGKHRLYSREYMVEIVARVQGDQYRFYIQNRDELPVRKAILDDLEGRLNAKVERIDARGTKLRLGQGRIEILKIPNTGSSET